MSETYDAIILGAGHNGLILQAYLGRAGLSTICLERRDVAGGGLATVELPTGSGFLHNTHAVFHRALDQMPWYADLDLRRHGAEYVEPELNVAMLLSDGRSLEWWKDFDRTATSFARFSEKDADTIRRWRDRFRPIVRDILIPEAQAAPLPPSAREAQLARSADGRLLLETSKPSPLDFALREFEHPAIQAGLLFFNGLREVDLRLPGFGHHIPALLASDSFGPDVLRRSTATRQSIGRRRRAGPRKSDARRSAAANPCGRRPRGWRRDHGWNRDPREKN